MLYKSIKSIYQGLRGEGNIFTRAFDAIDDYLNDITNNITQVTATFYFSGLAVGLETTHIYIPDTGKDYIPLNILISSITAPAAGNVLIDIQFSADNRLWNSILSAPLSLPINNTQIAPVVQFTQKILYRTNWLRAVILTGSDLTASGVQVQLQLDPTAPTIQTKPVSGLLSAGTAYSISGIVTAVGTLTADLPLFGNGGSSIKTGTKSGNTNEVATVLGALVSGNTVKSDANGNLVDSGFGPGGGGGGALTLLEQHTAAASATLDFTISITVAYDEYLIEFNNIVPATAGANILMRFSTDGGVTYDAGANYGWVGQRQSIAGTAGNVGSNATSSFGMDVSGGPTNTASRGGLTVTAKLFLSANGTIRPRMTWNGGLDDGTANLVIWVMASGEYLSVTAINAFRILASAGNITSGVVRVYGISH